MDKKKTLIIVFSCIGVVLLAVFGLLLGLNWNKITSWFNGARVYTYEEIQAATEDAYNKGVKEREALIKQVEDYKIQVDRLLTKVDSLNVDNSLKDEEISSLEKEIEALKKTITGSTLTETELTEELSYLQNKLNERLKSKWNEGYNKGIADGLLYGVTNVPDNSCVVVFNANIPQNSTSKLVGEMPLKVLSVDKNSLPQNTFTLKGYSFTGWNTAADGSGKAYADLSLVDSSLFVGKNVLGLFAQWSVNSYNCEFVVNAVTYNGLTNISSPVAFNLTANYDEFFNMPSFDINTLSLNHLGSDFDLTLKVNFFKWVNVDTGEEFSINELVRNLTENETVKFVANYDLVGDYTVKNNIVLIENGKNISMTMSYSVLFYNLSVFPQNATRITEINCLTNSSNRQVYFKLSSSNEFSYTDNLNVKYYLDKYNCFRTLQVGGAIGSGPVNLYEEKGTLTIENITYEILIKGVNT